MKILILYFSGVGATKKAAELAFEFLSQTLDTAIFSVEKATDLNMSDYDALIIGTPVHHAALAKIMTAYFNKICSADKTIPAFIFNTRGMYSCNTNRILAKQLARKNIIAIIDKSYKSPASDGSLITPYIKSFFEFEINFEQKIKFDCNSFVELFQCVYQKHMPRFRFSSIINAPNKAAGQFFTFKIYLHSEKCIKCGKCIENCPYNAIQKDDIGFPLFIKERCENCYRCIHHCKNLALSLSKRKPPKKVLNY